MAVIKLVHECKELRTLLSSGGGEINSRTEKGMENTADWNEQTADGIKAMRKGNKDAKIEFSMEWKVNWCKENTTWYINVKRKPSSKTYLAFLSSVFPHLEYLLVYFEAIFISRTSLRVAFTLKHLMTPRVFKPNYKFLIWAFKILRQITSNHLFQPYFSSYPYSLGHRLQIMPLNELTVF